MRMLFKWKKYILWNFEGFLLKCWNCDKIWLINDRIEIENI